jgi:hypothetical protein
MDRLTYGLLYCSQPALFWGGEMGSYLSVILRLSECDLMALPNIIEAVTYQ